ncbi:hypothetical protein KSP40_PGU021841 [Platanthera guangdongensis]|uniref:Uncharacterized protein n=1 Tax=Platanthera guangdongensis TaxID=2320717 RepID=A0ABR2MH85_9ASPA
MGICSSSESIAVAPIMTAKLILPDGELKEFAWPVKAALVLQPKDAEFFICDADEMEFGGFVSAVSPEEDLCPGQIYFLLPRSMLRQALQPEDLAAIAYNASSALMRAARGGTIPLVFSDARPTPTERTAARSKRRRGGKGRRFEASLSAILE